MEETTKKKATTIENDPFFRVPKPIKPRQPRPNNRRPQIQEEKYTEKSVLNDEDDGNPKFYLKSAPIEQPTKKSKNAPKELSSKKPVSRFKNMQKKIRDPRFDTRHEFHEDQFTQAYKFVDDIKKQELQEMKEQVRKTEGEEQDNLRKAINVVSSQLKAKERKEKRGSLKAEWQKQQKQRVSEGKKPVFLKQSDLKKLELVEKYKKLKEKGQVEKFMQKKLKRKAQKARKTLPSERRSE